MALSTSPQQNVPKMFESLLVEEGQNDIAVEEGDFGSLGDGDKLQLLAYSSRMARTCRHRCSISDPNAAKCWNDSLTFYEQMLIGMLRRTILVETNRILWLISRSDQPRSAVNYEQLISDSLQRFMQLPRGQIVADANDWKNAPAVFERISPAIMGSVRPLVNKLLHYYNNGNGQLNGPPPFLRFDCPRPCERNHFAWKWLFVGSLLVFLIQLALLSLVVFLLDRREQNAWRTERP
uniref:Uncharacterized protein n=1 Tax=Globodera rostochiensis TaxID=31243 RepID=A0A914H3P5_GLORO